MPGNKLLNLGQNVRPHTLFELLRLYCYWPKGHEATCAELEERLLQSAKTEKSGKKQSTLMNLLLFCEEIALLSSKKVGDEQSFTATDWRDWISEKADKEQYQCVIFRKISQAIAKWDLDDEPLTSIKEKHGYDVIIGLSWFLLLRPTMIDWQPADFLDKKLVDHQSEVEILEEMTAEVAVRGLRYWLEELGLLLSKSERGIQIFLSMQIFTHPVCSLLSKNTSKPVDITDLLCEELLLFSKQNPIMMALFQELRADQMVSDLEKWDLTSGVAWSLRQLDSIKKVKLTRVESDGARVVCDPKITTKSSDFAKVIFL